MQLMIDALGVRIGEGVWQKVPVARLLSAPGPPGTPVPTSVPSSAAATGLICLQSHLKVSELQLWVRVDAIVAVIRPPHNEQVRGWIPRGGSTRDLDGSTTKIRGGMQLGLQLPPVKVSRTAARRPEPVSG